jgi:hypothetical protein
LDHCLVAFEKVESVAEANFQGLGSFVDAISSSFGFLLTLEDLFSLNDPGICILEPRGDLLQMVLFMVKLLSLVIDTFEFTELFLEYCFGIRDRGELNKIVAGVKGHK